MRPVPAKHSVRLTLLTPCILGATAPGCKSEASLEPEQAGAAAEHILEPSAPLLLPTDPPGSSNSNPDGAPAAERSALDIRQIGSPAEGSPLHVFMTATLGPVDVLHDFCELGDRPLYCGLRAVLSLSGGALERDRYLEQGLPHDSRGWLVDGVMAGFGHFPNDAWLITFRENLVHPSRVCLHRWLGGRWQVVKTSLADPSVIAYVSLGRGGAVVARDENNASLEGLGTLHGVWHLVGSGNPCGARSSVRSLVGFDDGSMIGLTDFECDADEVIERWPTPAARPVLERLPHQDADGDRIVGLRGIWGTRPDNLVAYGELFAPNSNADTTRALLAHLENGHWMRSSTPPLVNEIAGYAVDAQGREWVMGPTLGEDMTNYHLWRRGSPNDWSNVPLPVRCQPWELKSVGGDVWVTCDAPPTGHDRTKFILSTRAPTRVVDLAEVLHDPADAATSSQSPSRR